MSTTQTPELPKATSRIPKAPAAAAPWILAVVGQKGGVGKSTIAIGLAVEAWSAGVASSSLTQTRKGKLNA